MFVQISPSAADVGETLCSLNFASRARGVENGPARKQGDVAELFKYKQMVCRLTVGSHKASHVKLLLAYKSGVFLHLS